MASSRESSPASEAGTASPAQLSPISKAKALLAAIPDESDDESVSGSARTRLLSSIAKTTSASTDTTKISEAITEDVPHSTAQEDTEDDEEEEIVRPKGRMAARMLAEEKSEEDEPAADDARERVRKMLMPKSKSPEPAANAEDGDGSDAEDVPVVSRKRKIRVPRRETPKSSPARPSASPGLFVSPRPDKAGSPDPNASDSDDIATSVNDNRFQALVAKKRAERLAREAEVAKEKAKKAAERKQYSSLLEKDDQFDDSDENVERRLTQQTHPTRKASKKAQEEIRRETQRLSRNQQLAHYAATKKKFPKQGLFAKFGFGPAAPAEEISDPVSDPVRPSSSSSAAPHSDVEMKETPPTSPASPTEGATKFIEPTTLPEMQHEDNGSLPKFEEMLTQLPSSPPSRLDKGKGKATEDPSPKREEFKKPLFKQRPIRVRPPKVADRKVSPKDESDSDLEIVTETPTIKKKIETMFDRIPAKIEKESRPIHALRMLAMRSPGKPKTGRNKKPSMTTTELQVSLQQRARQQAAREREERLQALRDKGIIIQTTEEREREMADVDDILARARREDEELMKREKADAKKQRKENGEVDPLGDSSDDEDWVEGKEHTPEDVSVSGSDEEMEEAASEEDENSGEDEEEDEEEDEAMAADAENALSNPMFDNEADESANEESEAELAIYEENAEDGDVDEDDEEPEQKLPVKQQKRRPRNPNVISDDEDDDEENIEQPTPQQSKLESPTQLHTESPMAPTSVLRSATKTFIPGLTVAGPAGLGLTQIFAGTMDESQTDLFEDSPTSQHGAVKDSLAFLRQIPAPELPPFVPTLAEDTQDVHMDSPSQLSHVPESQPHDSETQGIELNFSQSQIHGFDSLVQGTQMSQFPEATQDVGFQHMTPIRGRFVDAPSTVDTVRLDPTAVPETTEETPIVKKKGKLRRRAQVTAFSDDEDSMEPTELNVDEDEFDITTNAFDVMRKATKKKIVVDEFDKTKSKAKEMVNEQAEESEDEYAGLGGASDDEDGEEDDYVKGIIDDEGGKDVDERKIAAFYADRERANDEKQVEKLYKDITNGMLRRKRGADYDLSDSDDGGEARQRMKRKKFAKMQKALLADERICKIAENPKKQAFLRIIEDRGSEDEMDFLEDFAEQEETTDSQSQGEGSQQIIPDSQPTVMGPPKRKSSDDAEAESRPPPHLRRTKPAKKPSNLSEIRESLSSLIEEPNAAISQIDSGSETEEELEIEGGDDLGARKEKDKENRDPFALRRKNIAIIDRISLKRASSSSISNSTRLAFAASSTAPGFKVPPLLRRATTNSSIASSTSSSVSGGMSGTERMAGGSGGSDGVKRGGGKNSGVHYFARESERRAAVVKTEKRREQKLVKGAQVRRKVIGGLFGGGKFE
ncbi:hypothetical protein V8E51_008306 [Hyaloscypha variabilis]